MAKGVGSLEEGFGGDGEEFGGIGGAVAVEQGGNAGGIGGLQGGEFDAHDAGPGSFFIARAEERSAVGGEVFEVELVSEFVKDEVFAIGGIKGATFGRVPGEDEGAHGTGGFAEKAFAALLPDVVADGVGSIDNEAGGIDEDGEEAREVIGAAMEEEQAGLGGDGDSDFVGDV